MVTSPPRKSDSGKESGVSSQFFQWRSLKTRVTVFTLAAFALGIWSLSFYLSRSLQADMERLLSEQQFSVVTAVAQEVNDNLTDRLQALETIAKEMGPNLMGRPLPCRPAWSSARCCNCCSTAGPLSPAWTAYRLRLSPSPLKAYRVLASITRTGIF
jgi:hypothetical protein